MKYTNLVLGFLFFVSCASEKNENPKSYSGKWTAEWKTDPAAYAGINGIREFSMNGSFLFEENQVSINAYGFEGCVFSHDTLNHQLTWKVTGDSLILINEEDAPGMVYTIKSVSDKEIDLQLMDDIFLTLKR